jgi:hypothetical protein
MPTVEGPTVFESVIVSLKKTWGRLPVGLSLAPGAIRGRLPYPKGIEEKIDSVEHRPPQPAIPAACCCAIAFQFKQLDDSVA